MKTQNYYTFSRYAVFFLSLYNVNIQANAEFNALVIQPDELIVAAGRKFDKKNNVSLINRYTTAGLLDSAFGSNGSQTTLPVDASSAKANSVAIQADNKLVIAGSATIGQEVSLLVRYNSDGTLDSANFGVNGIVTTPLHSGAQINAIQIQADQKIVACGTTIINGSPRAFVARYNTDGTLDTNFGGTGIVIFPLINTTATGLVFDSGSPENIIISGRKDTDTFFIALYEGDGQLDPTFGTDGITETPVGNPAAALSLARQPADGKYIICGTSARDAILVRYNTDGTEDDGFGTGGIVIISVGRVSAARSVGLQADGAIVSSGFSDSFVFISRHLSNGTLDTNFGDNGIELIELKGASEASGVALDIAEFILAAGSTIEGALDLRGLILKLSPTAALDRSFGEDGIVLFPPSVTPPLIGNNFAFAYTTTTPQALATTFSPINFGFHGPFDGWSHTPGTSDFTCNRTGTYLIAFTGAYTATALALGSPITTHALIGSTEIAGSQVNSNMGVDVDPIVVSRSFITSIQAGEVLSLEHLRTGTLGTIQLIGAGAGTTPIGGTITINRLA